jgi:hypothetical protein
MVAHKSGSACKENFHGRGAKSGYFTVRISKFTVNQSPANIHLKRSKIVGSAEQRLTENYEL